MSEKNNDILVSVLMGIYNCADTLGESIESILTQTHKNFELIICDDGSTDNSYDIAKAYADKDSRIKLLKNEKNLTLGPTLNVCLSHACGKYCARMDADDVSVPERFQKQVDFLESNPQFDVVGSFMQIYGTDKLRTICEFPPIEHLAQGNPCCHATIMMRTEVYKELNGYSTDSSTVRIEDVDLFWRFYLAGHRAANIQQALYIVRENPITYKRRKMTFYVNSFRCCWSGCKKAKLKKKYYLYAIKPLIVGLLPKRAVLLYHSLTDK